jgi:TonB family protein
MKLSSTLICLLAACATPTAAAFADPGSEGARPFAVRITSDVKPAVVGEPGYPASAAVRDIEGSCVLTLDVDAAGRPRDVEVTHCSSDLFRREAAAIGEGLRFAPAARSDAMVDIGWSLARQAPQTATASLD